MTPRDITVAAVQTALYWEDREANLHQFGEKFRTLSMPVDLVVLPEMFTTGFSMQPAKLAEPTDGPTLNWMRKQAGMLDAVITGSIIAEENGKFYNRLLWVNPDGSFLKYDKRHLFRMAGEDKQYAAGQERLITMLHGWRVCPLVCYDLRFPVWSRNRWRNVEGTLEPDYDLLLYVANWPEVRSHAWKTLLTARAIENLSYVVGVNRIGNDGNFIFHSGDSAILDFRGNALKYGIIANEEILVSKLSWQLLSEFRKSFPAGLDADGFELK